jgi:anti-anti-sigma factor
LQSPATAWFLTITELPAADTLVLVVAGRLCTATAPRLAEALAKAGPRSAHVVLELSGVDYISSAGVRAIEQAAARLSGEGKVLAVRGALGATRLCLDMARVPQD